MTDKELDKIRKKYERADGTTIEGTISGCGEAPVAAADFILETFDIVPRLLDEIERLKAERTWISARDRLPEDEDSILGWSADAKLMAMDTGYGLKHGPFAGYSHWMPLPAPPA